MQKYGHSHLAEDANCNKILDRSAHNPELLQTHDAYLVELSPDDVASMREEGMAVAGAMWVATAFVVEEAKTTMKPGVRI